MPDIEIYTKDYCPYCKKAKDLLSRKGVTFTEIDVTHDKEGELQMRERSGQRTVPQIFIDQKGLGGCSELHELEKAGKLDGLLGQTNT